MATALALTGLIQLFACATFAYTAIMLGLRGATGNDRSAVNGFVAWWSGMSLYMGITGSLAIAASVGMYSMEVLYVSRLVVIPLVTIGAGGLTYYVLYLFTGRDGTKFLVGGYYAIVGAIYLTAGFLTRPTSVRVTDWSVELVPRIAGLDIIFLVFGIPAIGSAIAYLTLAFRPVERMQRYRIALVSSSILAWVVTGLLSELSQDPFLVFIGITFFGLVTALAVFFAYRPPGPFRRWLEPKAEALQDPRAPRGGNGQVRHTSR